MVQIYSNFSIYPTFVLYSSFPFLVQDPIRSCMAFSFVPFQSQIWAFSHSENSELPTFSFTFSRQHPSYFNRGNRNNQKGIFSIFLYSPTCYCTHILLFSLVTIVCPFFWLIPIHPLLLSIFASHVLKNLTLFVILLSLTSISLSAVLDSTHNLFVPSTNKSECMLCVWPSSRCCGEGSEGEK